jgi:hypothetical protein
LPKWFSYPGSSPPRPEGNGRKLILPDIHSEEHDTQLGEWLGSRSETSHLEVGLSPGDKVGFVDATGERRPAIVDHEERDSRTGKVDVYLHANDQTGSGSYKMTFEGDTARSLKSSRVKRIHE